MAANYVIRELDSSIPHPTPPGTLPPGSGQDLEVESIANDSINHNYVMKPPQKTRGSESW